MAETPDIDDKTRIAWLISVNKGLLEELAACEAENNKLADKVHRLTLEQYLKGQRKPNPDVLANLLATVEGEDLGRIVLPSSTGAKC